MQENATQKPRAREVDKERAASLVAEDALTNKAIAKSIGIDEATLYRWKKEPEFAERVAHFAAEFCEIVRSQGIARVETRIAALNDRWRQMQQVIEERAKHGAENEDMKGIPGAETGLIVRTETPVKNGVRVEYQVDTALLAEMRACEQQAAKDLGQWAERSQMNLDISALSYEELERVAAGKSLH